MNGVIIDGYGRNKYKIYPDGTVVSCGRIGARGYVVKEKTLSCYVNSSGYARVSLNLDGKNKDYFVHRLVATHFIPNPENKLIVNHIDGNKGNNSASNLEWVTSGENNKHAFSAGLKKPTAHPGEKHWNHKLSQKDVAYIKTVHRPSDKEFGSKALARKFGVRPQTITDIVHGRSWG